MASSAAGEIPCPDPSAHKHGKGQNLSEQASTAALYATNKDRENPLGSDGKLSSKSAATSLKYAKANELPSFPTAGLSANSAGKAAMLAKDYKMQDLWHPEASAAGSKAALLAHKDGGKLDLWQHTPSAAGNTAATMAMKTKGLSPQLDYGYTADGKSRALLAATMSVKEGRRRAGSTPVPMAPAYPDSKNSAANALSAATASHRASKPTGDGWNSEANQAARVQNLKAGKEWFGERPPVDIDPDDTKHQAALHASAKSMAKQMYDYQNQKAAGQDGTAGAQAAHANQSQQEQRDVKQEAMRYIHLQDAAHKLAQEKLAKVDKSLEHDKYREYYGYGNQPQQASPRRQANRLSMRGRPRQRASSEGGSAMDDSDDEEQARRIRTQMSTLNSGLGNVDIQKRTDDRAKLMAAAEARVHARMHDMDEKVFQDTGKVPPAMMEEWETKARKRAQEDKEIQAQNPGKTHIGGGKFIDNQEIEAIAAARLKPTLDEITDTAERRRAHDEELRLEREEQDRTRREEKAEKNREKDEQKRAKNEEKAVAKQQKEEVKARKEEEKRIAKEDKRKSHDTKREDVAVLGAGTAGNAAVAGTAGDRPVQTTSKADKRTSTLGRITSRLHRKNKSVEERDVDRKSTEDRPVTAILSPPTEAAEISETPVHTSTTPVVTTGTAGAEAEATQSTIAADNTAPAIVEPSVDADELRDVHQEMHPVTSTHTGGQNAALLAAGTSAGRPDLERHISTIETSDEEDGEDSDEDDEMEANRAHPSAVAGVDHRAPVSSGVTPAEHPARMLATEPAVEQESPAGGAGLLFPAAHETTHEDAVAVPVAPAETTAVIPSAGTAGRATTDAVSHTGPHTTAIANLLDPHVDSASEPLDRVSSDQVLKDFGTHEELAPVIDPRVRAEPAVVPTATTSKTDMPIRSTSDALAEPGVISTKAEPAVAPATTSVASSSQAPKTETGESEKKGGLRGFLGKLRNKSSKSDNRLSKPGGSATIGTSGNTSIDATRTTSSEAPKISGLDSSASVSSFRRGEGRALSSDFGDVSSGLESDDLARGRAGRTTVPIQTAGMGSDVVDRQMSAVSTSNDEETFEEARDHFDESLAPPAAFGGQVKELRESGSPVRGTKFVEEL